MCVCTSRFADVFVAIFIYVLFLQTKICQYTGTHQVRSSRYLVFWSGDAAAVLAKGMLTLNDKAAGWPLLLRDSCVKLEVPAAPTLPCGLDIVRDCCKARCETAPLKETLHVDFLLCRNLYRDPWHRYCEEPSYRKLAQRFQTSL